MLRLRRRWWLLVLAGAVLGSLLLVAWLRAAPPLAAPPPAAEEGRPAAHPQPSAAPRGSSAPPVPTTPTVESAQEAVGGALDGWVVSKETGVGIWGAEVTWSSPSGAHSVVTSADGQFSFRPVAPGEFQLASVHARGFLSFGPEWGKSPVRAVLRAAARIRGLRIELEPSVEIVGVVVDATQAPVAGAAARVLAPSKDHAALFPVRDQFVTNARGEFLFRAPVFATVEAFHETRGAGSAQLEPGSRRLTIELVPHPPERPARGSLSGRVVSSGVGVSGALVLVASAVRAYPTVFGSDDGYRELTSDDGSFVVRDLVPGTYDVSAHAPGSAPAHRFDVRVPQAQLLLELGAGRRIVGRVSDELGRPVPDFEVRLQWKKAPLERLVVVDA